MSRFCVNQMKIVASNYGDSQQEQAATTKTDISLTPLTLFKQNYYMLIFNKLRVPFQKYYSNKQTYFLVKKRIFFLLLRFF